MLVWTAVFTGPTPLATQVVSLSEIVEAATVSRMVSTMTWVS